MKTRQMKIKEQGFTLLEVMIAITIMTIAFAAILSSQSSSIILTMKSKEMNTASWLANNVMVESEHLYEGKPFSEVPTEQAGQFPEPFAKYSWKREVKEMKFPDFSMISGPDQKQIPETVRLIGKVMTKYLNDSVRELVVTISWTRGKGTQKITISTYLVDLTQEFNFQI